MEKRYVGNNTKSYHQMEAANGRIIVTNYWIIGWMPRDLKTKKTT